MRLLLMRHWEPQIPPGPRRYIGQTNYPLSPAGITQAENSGPFITHTYGTISCIWSSPLLRCSQGAKILAKQWNCPVIYSDSLREIHMGSWDNLPINHIREHFPLEYEKRGRHMDTYAAPGGESFLQVQIRALAALRQILSSETGNSPSDKTVLIMTHAGVIRCLLCHLNSQPLHAMFAYKITWGEIIPLPNTRNLRLS